MEKACRMSHFSWAKRYKSPKGAIIRESSNFAENLASQHDFVCEHESGSEISLLALSPLKMLPELAAESEKHVPSSLSHPLNKRDPR
jgi:hypothetical protein